MTANYLQSPARLAPDRTVLVGFALMFLAIIVGVFIVAALNDAFEAFPYLFLLPWVMVLAVVMAVPSVILYYRGEFSFANPIVFATASYFFPAFVIGGVLLATGFSQPYYLSFIQEPEYNLPFTIVLIALGFVALSLGYFVPVGAKLGDVTKAILPKADYSAGSFLFPGIVLLALGVFNTIFAFGVGLFGYQLAAESNIYAGIIYLSTLMRVEGAFLLWLVVLRQRTFSSMSIVIIGLLTLVDLGSAVFAGNRGSILQTFFVIFLAFVFSGRRLRLRHGVIAGVVLAGGIVVGMVYGTTFRMVKGTEAQQSSDQYADNVLQTFDQVGRTGTYDSLSLGLSNLAERLDIVSTLAVVVSNQEQLKPYEEAYGFDNNIWIDTTTFFIPRVIWNDKPAASDSRKYSDLYFNAPENSFAITPIGDLLRNFGIVGIAIGMFILGVIVRFLYQTLIGSGQAPIWRIMFYFMLLTTLSYEGFFGTIVPTMFKVGFIALIGVLIVTLLARKLDARATSIAL